MLQPECPILAPDFAGDPACLLRSICLDEEPGYLAKAAASLGSAIDVPRGCLAPLTAGSDAIVFICAGATKLIAKASGGREQIVAFHFQNDIVSIAAPDMHAYSLQALHDTKIVIFPAQSMIEAAKTDPAFMKSLLQRSLVSLYRCRDKALGLGRKTAQERLASFFAAMAERIGIDRKGRCELDLPMSRGDIADSLGLTIETISRQFSELRNAGLIETDGRSHVSLLDMPAIIKRTGQFPQ